MAGFLEVLKKAGWLQLIAYFFCICFFSVQMYRLVEHLVSPTMTHTFVREVPLKDIDFPLDIKICVSPSLNSTTLKEFGYDDIDMYVAGSTSRSNYSYIGWGGHDHNGRNLASARKVLNKAKLNVTKDVLRNVFITTHEDDMIMKELSGVDLVKINRLHNCHILKLDQEHMKGMKVIHMYFNEKSQNSSVEVKLQGHGLTSHREIKKHRFYSSGDVMKLNSFVTGYIVKIKERVFVEEDQSQTCRNYPTSEFTSYTECDNQYVKRQINQLAPGFNLTPIWTTDNLDLVTTQPLPANISMLGNELIQVIDTFLLSVKLDNLFFGVDPSDCPLPCKTFSTEVKYSDESDQQFGIYLSFLPTVEVVNFILFSFVMIS